MMTVVRKGKEIVIIEIITGTKMIEMTKVECEKETERGTGTGTGTGKEIETVSGIGAVIMIGTVIMTVTVIEDTDMGHILAQGGQGIDPRHAPGHVLKEVSPFKMAAPCDQSSGKMMYFAFYLSFMPVCVYLSPEVFCISYGSKRVSGFDMAPPGAAVMAGANITGGNLGLYYQWAWPL
eukprot:Gb_20114 [translate_table: standard]